MHRKERRIQRELMSKYETTDAKTEIYVYNRVNMQLVISCGLYNRVIIMRKYVIIT